MSFTICSKKLNLQIVCYLLRDKNKKACKSMIYKLLFVGAPGFELGTSWSQTRRANQTALRPAD